RVAEGEARRGRLTRSAGQEIGDGGRQTLALLGGEDVLRVGRAGEENEALRLRYLLVERLDAVDRRLVLAGDHELVATDALGRGDRSGRQQHDAVDLSGRCP